MGDDDEHEGDADPEIIPVGGGLGETGNATQPKSASDGQPGFPIEGFPGVRAGAFGAGQGLLGIVTAGEAPPSVTPAPRGGSIDWAFIHQREAAGGPNMSMYVPADSKGHVLDRSGPTIGYGFDVGQRSPRELQQSGWRQPLVDALTPYTRQTGAAAQAYVNAHPLTLSQADIDSIDQTVRDRMASDLAAKFDAASQVGPFSSLPAHTQTVITDLYHQYGWSDPARAAPNFWRQITSGDWQNAYGNLLAFHDHFRPRRTAEAALLKLDMDAGILPAGRGPSGS